MMNTTKIVMFQAPAGRFTHESRQLMLLLMYGKQINRTYLCFSSTNGRMLYAFMCKNKMKFTSLENRFKKRNRDWSTILDVSYASTIHDFCSKVTFISQPIDLAENIKIAYYLVEKTIHERVKPLSSFETVR